MTDESASHSSGSRRAYGRFVLLVAGLGGLLYGIDVGIIGGALPYLEATAHLNAGQLSIIVAAVLLGSVISTLFAGLLADRFGRRMLMVLSGLAFVVSIPVIALSHGYGPLFLGRLLQGMSGGFIGVVVPLYLAECLAPDVRGKGTGLFQWLLTLGIVAAAGIGMYYSYRVQVVQHLGDADALFRFKDQAWRHIFWVSLPPGVLFVVGSLLVAESPRWLFQRGRREAAFAALLRSRGDAQAQLELEEMAHAAAVTSASPKAGTGAKQQTLLQRRYVIPFLLACVILFCNTATGTNSIIGYNTSILLQSGLSDLSAHWGYVVFTSINFVMTLVGVALVDRRGRKFLFVLGTSGMVLSLVIAGGLFLATESHNLDCTSSIRALVTADQTLTVHLDPAEVTRLLNASSATSRAIESDKASLVVIYSYGGFTSETSFLRSDDADPQTLTITRDRALPSSRVEAFFKNPFLRLDTARTAPLQIERARIGRIPKPRHGWLVAASLYGFIAFYALGPGVCVWLALSELMPTRIRSNGMSIALVINQLVSTVLAGIFLPVVSKHGYASMFFLFAGFTLVYFLVVTFALPETKGRTLEEIEAFFKPGGGELGSLEQG